MVEVIPRKGVIVKPVILQDVMQIARCAPDEREPIARDLPPSAADDTQIKLRKSHQERARGNRRARRSRPDDPRPRVSPCRSERSEKLRAAPKSCESSTSGRCAFGSFRSPRRTIITASKSSTRPFSPPSAIMTIRRSGDRHACAHRGIPPKRRASSLAQRSGPVRAAELG